MNEERREGQVGVGNLESSQILVGNSVDPLVEMHIDHQADATPIEGEYRLYQIKIKPLHYGYIVEVGCHSFAFEKIEDATKHITDYYNDPKGVREKWDNGELLKKNKA